MSLPFYGYFSRETDTSVARRNVQNQNRLREFWIRLNVLVLSQYMMMTMWLWRRKSTSTSIYVRLMWSSESSWSGCLKRRSVPNLSQSKVNARLSFYWHQYIYLAKYAVIPVLPYNSHTQYYFYSSRACKQTESSVSNHWSVLWPFVARWELLLATKGRSVSTKAKCVTSWPCPISSSINSRLIRKRYS